MDQNLTDQSFLFPNMGVDTVDTSKRHVFQGNHEFTKC